MRSAAAGNSGTRTRRPTEREFLGVAISYLDGVGSGGSRMPGQLVRPFVALVDGHISGNASTQYTDGNACSAQDHELGHEKLTAIACTTWILSVGVAACARARSVATVVQTDDIV
jgi:hypothetical protein